MRKIGYARVSTSTQNLDRQIGALRAERCDDDDPFSDLILKVEHVFDRAIVFVGPQISAGGRLGAIEPSIRRAEIERARRKRPENLDAYDLYYLRALPMAWAFPPEETSKAIPLLVGRCSLIQATLPYTALRRSAICAASRGAN
jgi:hypothetical protein